MNQEKQVNVPFQIKEDLIHYIPPSEVRKRIQYLVNLFKDKYEKLFPTKISDETTLLFLMHLSYSLENLSQCAGFDRHLVEFNNDVESTYFVTVIANYLLSMSQDVEIEPKVEGMSKQADIRIDLDGIDFYIECKNPKKDVLTALRVEQEPMYEVLKDRISKPCDVFIAYNEPLSGEQLEQIGSFLESRLPKVTGEGTIFNRDSIEISVTNIRDSIEDIGEVQTLFILENRYAERHPIHLINRNGIAIGFTKKNLSVIDSVEQQLKKSRRKVPNAAPLIVAVQSEYITGSISSSLREISSLFQPAKYTSFNGVLLANWRYNFQSLIDMDFHYVNNPYSKNPVLDIERLFRKNQ